MLLKILIISLPVFVIFTPLYASAEKIDIFIRDDVYADYVRFVNGRDVLTIADFKGQALRRDVVDMVLAQQALSLGQFNHTFNYFAGKVNFRNTKMLQSGDLLMSFDSYWQTDANAIKKYIYISDPVIRKGEYLAGVYTHPTNKKALSISKFEDFNQLTAVSTPKWRTDWSTLKTLNLKELIQENEWLSMAQMVNIKWVDFLLMPFHSEKDKSFKLGNIELIPAPGVVVQLNDSRHFVVSKKHKYGEAAFYALQIGLAILRKQKTIEKAYIEAGFFVDKQQYKILNPT